VEVHLTNRYGPDHRMLRRPVAAWNHQNTTTTRMQGAHLSEEVDCRRTEALIREHERDLS
jgi:hypothetical protein